MQGKGEENARREIFARREILKKESDFKYFLLHRSCCLLLLFGILRTLMTYRPPKSCFSQQVTWSSNFALVYFSSYFFLLENQAFESTFSLAPAWSLNTTKITDLQEKQTFHLPLKSLWTAVLSPQEPFLKRERKKDCLDTIAILLQIFSNVPLSLFYSFWQKSHNFEK